MPAESEHQYLWRLGLAKANGETDLTWDEIATLINKEFRADESEYRTEAAYRKKFQYTLEFYEAGVFNRFSEDDYIKDLSEKRRELERAKIQYRDERNAWSKQNYIDARVDDKLDRLEKALKESGRTLFPINNNLPHRDPSGRDLLLLLSDLHIGAAFENYWGSYNAKIAEDRMGQLLAKVQSIMDVEGCSGCNVVLLGDCISGSIHRSVQVTNRDNVIDQIKTATELISSFIYELTKTCSYVRFSSVSGNHSRIDKKEDAIHSERMDDLVAWGVTNKLDHIDNFYVTGTKFDTSISVVNILNKNYVAVHGDYDSFAKSGVQNLCTMLKMIPEAVLFGHMHTCAVDEVNGIKMVRGGSLAGSGDDFTIERRLSGSPSQMACVCDDTGILSYHPIVLK